MRKNRVAKSLKSFLTKMSNLLNASTSRKGSPAITDINKLKYVRNGDRQHTTNWRCSVRKCPATIRTRKSTGNLVGDSPRQHNHGNKLLCTIAKEKRISIILFFYFI